MKLGVCAWSFPELTLTEAAGVARALGLEGIDVGLFYKSALDKNKILTDPEAAAQDLRAMGLPVPCYYHLLGADLTDRNAADPTSHERNLTDLEAVARFCAAAEIPVLFLLPGILGPGQRRGDAFASATEMFRSAMSVVAEHGVTLSIEPHVHSILESPAATLEFLEAVPGLRLQLDYSHFVCLGWTQAELDALIPFAAHVHLRQARAGRLQERLQYGTINFNSLLDALSAQGYDGWFSLEALHQDYIDSWDVDVITETAALRDLVRNWDQAPSR